MEITRAWCMPNKHTFKIKPIKGLLNRYANKGFWVDPFAGEYSTANTTNDLNHEKQADYCMEAHKFLDKIVLGHNLDVDGVLFDPPYSLNQLKECYEGIGSSLPQWQTRNACRWTKERNIIEKIIKPKGVVISFGWNTCCMGKKRGFEIEEILIVAHGPAHYDTLVTVERKTTYNTVQKEREKICN